jgi:hypothetical protein
VAGDRAVITWECEVPLRDGHKLTEAAQGQLAARVVGVPVTIGYPMPDQRPPGRPRGDASLGRVGAAYKREGGKVKLVLHLLDGDDTVRVALDELRAGRCGVGLDMTIESPDTARLVASRELLATAELQITEVTGVRAVAVVPMAGPGPIATEATGG